MAGRFLDRGGTVRVTLAILATAAPRGWRARDDQSSSEPGHDPVHRFWRHFGRGLCAGVRGTGGGAVAHGHPGLQQCLAVNGWAGSTCCPSTMALSRNPGVPLAVQLDGAWTSWLSPTAAIVALRRGQLYTLQQTTAGESGDLQWSLLPTGQTLGAVGEVSDLVTLPLENHRMNTADRTKTAAWLSDRTEKELSFGFLFAGSRLGDSLLLGFALELVTMPWQRKEDPSVKEENEKVPSSSSFVSVSPPQTTMRTRYCAWKMKLCTGRQSRRQDPISCHRVTTTTTTRL